MKFGRGLFGLGLATMIAAFGASSVVAAKSKSCGQVGFTSGSEDGAFSIRAKGTGCATAKKVARASEPHGISDGAYKYKASGFSCRGKYVDDPIPTVLYRCKRGSKLVTFARG